MNRKIWLGLGLLVATYGQLLVSQDWAALHHFQAGFIFATGIAFFTLGIIILSEGIVQRFDGVSLLSLARGGGWELARFLLVAAGVGILLEVFGQWLGKLWYYPYYPTWFYWPSFIPSFILYWVTIAESYMAVKAIFDRLIRRGGRDKKPLDYYQFEHTLYILLGAAGIGMLIFGLINIFFDYQTNGGYTFNVFGPVYYAPPMHHIIVCLLGFWFIGEGVLYTRDLPSLIRSTLHGYFVPLLSIVGAAVPLSLIWESQNAQVGFWIDANWPSINTTIFRVPLSTLAAWPAHYVFFFILPGALVTSWASVFWGRPEQLKDKEKKHA
jgi:hypothetical protein